MNFPSLNLADIIKSIKNYFTTKKTEVIQFDTDKKKRAKELLDYYSGNQKSYLKGRGFEDAETGAELISLSTLNITKKIIDKISMVYKYPPERSIVNEEGEEIETSQDYSKWINYVETFDNTITEAERQKNLFHKVLWRNHYNPIMKQWKFLIEWDYKAHFISGDPLNPIGYSVPIVIASENLHREDRVADNEQIYLYYDNERYFYYNTKGNVWTYFVDYDGNEQDNDGVNLFGVSPFIEIRKGIPVYQYETFGALDLISSNEAINQNLNNLNMALHYQAFGVIWDNSGLDKEAGQAILIGPNRQVHVGEKVTLNNLDLNPKLLEMIDTIKFEVQAISNTYNLSVNWHNEATPVSGFSLIVQNMDYIEQRQKDVDEAKMQESRIFKSIKAQQDYFKGELGEDEPTIPDGKLVVDFQELDLPINDLEEIAVKEYKLRNNIITPVDEIKADNPDMDDEQALEKYMKNKKINGTLTAAEEVREGLAREGVQFASDIQTEE
jgi:hypothetical protein